MLNQVLSGLEFQILGPKVKSKINRWLNGVPLGLVVNFEEKFFGCYLLGKLFKLVEPVLIFPKGLTAFFLPGLMSKSSIGGKLFPSSAFPA